MSRNYFYRWRRADQGPAAIKTGEIKNHVSALQDMRKTLWILTDAVWQEGGNRRVGCREPATEKAKLTCPRSMSIYSFLVAVRSDGQQLMSDTGETTSHLMGMFYRTLRIVDNGVSADPNLRAYGTGSDEFVDQTPLCLRRCTPQAQVRRTGKTVCAEERSQRAARGSEGDGYCGRGGEVLKTDRESDKGAQRRMQTAPQADGHPIHSCAH
jgi:hypothetical protein